MLLYSESVKGNFRDFIIKKKFYEGAKPGKVEPFTSKGDDKNVFYAKSHLPYNFGLGVFLTPFYTVLLLLLSFRILKKRMKVPEPKKAYQIEKEKDNTLFVLCEKEEIKTDIFNYYQNQKNSICLEKINTGDFMFNGVKAHEIFKHLSIVSGVDENKAFKHLEYMGIKDLKGLPVCHEIILKIYVAVKTAADFDLIVLNDFIKKESREFEHNLCSLLLFLEKSGKKILYLSTEMFQTKISSNNFDEKIEVDKFTSLPVNLNKAIFR